MSPTPQELQQRYRDASAKVEQLRTKAASYEAARDLHTARLAELTAKLGQFGVATVDEAVALASRWSTELDARLVELEAQLSA